MDPLLFITGVVALWGLCGLICWRHLKRLEAKDNELGEMHTPSSDRNYRNDDIH